MRLNEQKRLDSDGIKANLRGKLSNENFQTLQNEIKDECRKIEDALKALEYERKSLLEAAQQTKLPNVNFVRHGAVQRSKAKSSCKKPHFLTVWYGVTKWAISTVKISG